MISNSSERTLTGALIPPLVGHINGVQSTAFEREDDLLSAGCITSSLIADWYIKSLGRSNLHATWMQLPLLSPKPALNARYLALNCLTSHYSALWEKMYESCFQTERWSQSDNTRLHQSFWTSLGHTWKVSSGLRSDYARRMAMIEIDVLVAKQLELTLDELLLIFRVQFPVLQQNEDDTWYDANGRIVFTCNIGLAAGIGIQRKGGKNTPRTLIVIPDGKSYDGTFGWEDLWSYPNRDADTEEVCRKGGRPKVPDGSVITQWVIDDTLPGGPREVQKTYIAPFTRANRENDYKVAWDFFSSRENT